jgi:DNA replicative helicase MCM subunit Mcm2 (Cdc46/Mcm family)
VALYYAAERGTDGDDDSSTAVPQEFLKEYIMYARRAVAPQISDAAVEALVQVRWIK